MAVEFEIKNNKVFLEIPYDFKDLVKQIPGRRWVNSTKQWSLPYNEDAVALANSLLGTSIPAPKVDRVADRDRQPASGLVLSNLYDHQKISVAVARKTKFFPDLSEPGTGKTLVQIELMLERDAWPVLIICPKSIMGPVWQEQISQSMEIHHIQILEGGSAKVKKVLNQYWESPYIYDKETRFIALINYDMVSRVIDELLGINWRYIILDESTKIKSPNAARSKAIMKLRDRAEYRSIMTGTVAPNGLQDIFNQMKFINPKIFGDSFYSFRHTYFTQGGYKNYEWFARPDAIEKVTKKIKGISVQHHKRDCVDLPPLVEEIREIEMTPEQKIIYDQMKDEMIVWLSEQKAITAPFVVTKIMKLRQIASGFIYDDGASIPVAKTNPKDSALFEILEQLGDQKCIIFAHFNRTIEHLRRVLDKSKYLSIAYYGSEKSVALEVFEKKKTNPGPCQILIANPASAGHGLNLQFCSNIIYYEHDFALENYLQSYQRIERIGQKNKMTLFSLLTKHTIEKYIHKKLKNKEDVNKRLDINELKDGINGIS